MKTALCSEVLKALEGKTLVTAESLTGGGIGAAITAVSGASAIYKGGVISYVNAVKNQILGVPESVLERFGAVSAPSAEAMAVGVRKLLNADIAVSVTGLAGPGGDEFGHPVGTVFIGYDDEKATLVKHCCFCGTREEIREQTIETALKLILEQQK